MRVPDKLTHGDTLARLFDKFNAVVDYLRAIRLVAGAGIRLNALPSGLTIESTATGAGGGSNGAGVDAGHPFDVELLTGGTEESPEYSVRVFNSGLPESPYAGVVSIGTATYSVPVDELTIEAGEGEEFWVDLVITYDAETDPVYTLEFEVVTDPDTEDPDNVFRQTIAAGIMPEIASEISGNITVLGRWV